MPAVTDVVTASILDELNATREIVNRITYRPEDYRFEVGVDVPSGRIFIQLQHYREDVDNPGTWAWGKGGKRYLEPHMCESAVVRVALGAAISYEEHEVRESFLYKGKRIFGPHLSVEALAEIADRTE